MAAEAVDKIKKDINDEKTRRSKIQKNPILSWKVMISIPA